MNTLDDWLADRPQVIKDMGRAHPPTVRYRYEPTGQIGHIYSYAENETVTMIFPVEWNEWQTFSREVFGILPETLIPLDEDK